MRAIVVSRCGDPDELVVTDIPSPTPGTGQILVDVSTASVNHLDIFHRTGLRPRLMPFTPGIEGCGRVREVGENVTGFRVGDRVGWVLVPGAYAERVVIPASRAVLIPPEVPDELAAAGLLHGMSARYLTSAVYPVGASDTVLVQGAGYGTRLLIIQLAKAAGARVIATIRDPASVELVAAAGADEVLNWDTPHLDSQIQQLTDGHGVNVVYDAVGQPTFATSLAALRTRGTYAQISDSWGQVPPIDPAMFTAGSYMYCRPILAHFITRRSELLESAAQVFDWIVDGTLTIRPGEHYALAEAGKAQGALERHPMRGKPLVKPFS